MGGELAPSAFPAGPARGPRESPASVRLLAPSACDGKESAKGCQEHLSPTGSGGWLRWRGVGWWRGPCGWTNIIPFVWDGEFESVP